MDWRLTVAFSIVVAATFGVRGAAADIGEPNDTHVQAVPIASGVPITSHIATSNDVDYYRFTAPGTQHVRVDLAVPAARRYTITLLEVGVSEPHAIAFGDEASAGLPQRLDWTVAPGTYWIRIQAAGCCASPNYDAINPYQLLLTTPQPGDTFEPNETSATAAVLMSGPPVTSYIATSNDIDVYTFTVSSTQHIRLDLTVPAQRTYSLTLFEAGVGAPQAIAFGQGSGAGLPWRLDWTVTPGTYWVRVEHGCCSPLEYDADHPYTLQLTAPQPGDAYEPNETVPTAAPLVSGQPRTSFIATYNDVDTYTFSVTSTQHIRLDLTMPAQLTYTVTLLTAGPGGTQPIAYGQGGGAGVPQRIDWTVAPGTYWVRVEYGCCSALRYDSQQPYTLLLTAPQPGDSHEPNGTVATAAPLLSGQPDVSYIATANDVDYFTFAVSTARQIRLQLDVPAQLTYALTLLAQGNTTPTAVAFGQGGGDGVAQVIERSVTAGTYWVRVQHGCCSSRRYDPVQPYTLLLTGGDPAFVATGSLTLSASPTTQLVGGAVTLTAAIRGPAGQPLAGESVQFVVADAGVVGAAVTDASGHAVLRYSRSTLGTVMLSARANAVTSALRSVTWSPPAGATPGRPDPLGPTGGLLEPPRFAIVLVHGINSDRGTWENVREAITATALPNAVLPQVHAITFSDRYIRAGLAAWATELSAYLQDLASQVGQPTKFILVAHSAGGLAARRYLQSDTYRHDVAALITYGSPHAGTPAAQLACRLLTGAPQTLVGCDAFSQGMLDMKPGSEFLNGINSRPLPEEVRYVSLVGSGINGCGLGIQGVVNVVVPEPNDCIVPAASQDLTRSSAASARNVQRWLTGRAHTEQTSDLVGILKGLELAGFRKAPRMLAFDVQSPIDIIVTDPAGRRVGKSIAEVPWATYDEYVGEDGALHDSVLIPLPLPGEYHVQAIAHPGAAPTETYSIIAHHDGAQTVVASSVPVGDIPAAGYAVANTERRYLAEGATGSLFSTTLALLNAEATPATARLRFQPGAGPVIAHNVLVPARTRVTVDASAVPGLASSEFSTVVESDQPLVVDRTMSWDGTGYGAHAETAVAAPSTTWYLAEGATHSGFDLFYLLQNPATAATSVRVRYLRGVGTPLEKTYTLPPTSRTNIWVNVEEFPGVGRALASADVSAVIESQDGTPIIVERAMYLSSQGRIFNAGHESMGVTTPATQWFLAEGATGAFFDLFVLIANPTSVDANVTVTYLLGDGTTYTRPLVAPANSRSNIWVDMEEIPGVPGRPLADVAVSTTVTSTNGVPIVVERAMWWPGGGGTWHEAHNSAGSTQAGTQWALAEGEVGGVRQTETYILIANTSSFGGHATVTLLFEDGTSDSREYTLLPNSRSNVPVSVDFASSANRRFGALVESTGQTPAQIVVERAMYSNAGAVQWAAGTNALGTRLR